MVRSVSTIDNFSKVTYKVIAKSFIIQKCHVANVNTMPTTCSIKFKFSNKNPNNASII